MKVLIVDDEPLARRRLWRLLANIPQVEVVGEAEDGARALTMIAALAPDLVLLDVDMPGLDGIALAKRLTSALAVVFTTAHREHAVDAFAVEAVDYLLKPIEEARLLAAVERARARQAPVPEGIVRVLPQRSLPLRLQARSGGVLELLDPSMVSRLFASDKYTLCKIAGREYVLDDSLSRLETKLRDHGFLRVHRKELVNLGKVRALHVQADGAELELEGGERVQVSRRLLAELRAKLSGA